jgi:hypothetical protein
MGDLKVSAAINCVASLTREFRSRKKIDKGCAAAWDNDLLGRLVEKNGGEDRSKSISNTFENLFQRILTKKIHFNAFWRSIPTIRDWFMPILSALFCAHYSQHNELLQQSSITQSQPGLPDFSWYTIPKLEKNVQPNEHKLYQMVVKYPKCL